MTTDAVGQQIEQLARTLTPGWQAASEIIKPTKRLILAASAHPKTGKSRLAMTAPEPVYIANFDDGLEGVADEFIRAGKDVRITHYHFPEGANPTVIQSVALPIYAQFMVDLRAAMAGGTGTIVLDTHTEQWEMCRFAYFGRVQQIMPYMYGPVNASMRSLIREFYSSGMNVVMSRRLAKKYVNDNWNGEYEPKGYNGLEYETQINVRMGKVEPDQQGDVGYFWLQVVDCRQNSSVNGKVYFNQDIHFKQLVADVFGGIEMEGGRMFLPGETAKTFQEARERAGVVGAVASTGMGVAG